MEHDLPISSVRQYLLGLQQHIVDSLGRYEGHPFRTDAWERPHNERSQGDGVSCVVEDGNCFERGGVNFSHVRGDVLPASATAGRPNLSGRSFEALGVSLVLHPRNPYCPTVHMNMRLFIATQAGKAPVFRFGGGMDLTPCYGFEEDARHFHGVCHEALAPFGSDLYLSFKTWCDDYFFLKHRNEPRGIGGIFFDDFSELGFQDCFAMMRSVGDAFLSAYLPIVGKRKELEYGARERAFQQYRRGRYVEFNLIYDRGTLFGLQSDGRTESILMSMPPSAGWRYEFEAPPGSPEAELLSDFLICRDWLRPPAAVAAAGRRMPSPAASPLPAAAAAAAVD